jgi:hypothetical protein
MSLSPPRIVCAAIKCGDVLLIGARHYDSHMREQKTRQNIKSRHADEVQGFIDQHGNFYDRREAWIVAEFQEQIRRPIDGNEGVLYSENLY